MQLESRVQALEIQNRRLQKLTLVAVLIGSAGVLSHLVQPAVSQQGTSSRVQIEEDGIVINDAKGQPAIMLHAGDFGPSLVFWDAEAEKPAVVLSSDKDSAELSLTRLEDRQVARQMSMRMHRSGSTFSITEGQQTKVMLSHFDGLGPRIGLYTVGLYPHLELGVSGGWPDITFNNNDGQPVWEQTNAPPRASFDFLTSAFADRFNEAAEKRTLATRMNQGECIMNGRTGACFHAFSKELKVSVSGRSTNGPASTVNLEYSGRSDDKAAVDLLSTSADAMVSALTPDFAGADRLLADLLNDPAQKPEKVVGRVRYTLEVGGDGKVSFQASAL
jgi:hypothetical protein